MVMVYGTSNGPQHDIGNYLLLFLSNAAPSLREWAVMNAHEKQGELNLFRAIKAEWVYPTGDVLQLQAQALKVAKRALSCYKLSPSTSLATQV